MKSQAFTFLHFFWAIIPRVRPIILKQETVPESLRGRDRHLSTNESCVDIDIACARRPERTQCTGPPNSLIFEFLGFRDCPTSDNNQTSFSCCDKLRPFDSDSNFDVSITSNDGSIEYFSDTISTGHLINITIDESASNEQQIFEPIKMTIEERSGPFAFLLQEVTFDINCRSEPLRLFDTFASIQLASFTNNRQGDIPFGPSCDVIRTSPDLVWLELKHTVRNTLHNQAVEVGTLLLERTGENIYHIDVDESLSPGESVTKTELVSIDTSLWNEYIISAMTITSDPACKAVDKRLIQIVGQLDDAVSITKPSLEASITRTTSTTAAATRPSTTSTSAKATSTTTKATLTKEITATSTTTSTTASTTASTTTSTTTSMSATRTTKTYIRSGYIRSSGDTDD